MSNDSKLKENNYQGIVNEICNLVINLDLDLMIEYPPLTLYELIDQCHSLNESIQQSLVQNILYSVQGSKVVDFPVDSMNIIWDFIYTIMISNTNLSLLIGNSIDSEELRFGFAKTIYNLYNVYYIDSRKINLFFHDILTKNLFNGIDSLINIEKIYSNDTIKHNLQNSFTVMLIYAYFQDEECQNYAIDNIMKMNTSLDTNKLHHILTDTEKIPHKVKICATNMYIYLKSLFEEQTQNQIADHEDEIRILLIIFAVLLHCFWIPFSNKWNSKWSKIFIRISNVLQSDTVSEL